MGKLQRIALFAILGLIVLYAGDYVAMRLRGQTLGSVDVQIMWAVKQKDNRIDYELGDTETRPCVHSLFPQMGYTPCWYLSRHKNQTITVGSIPKHFANWSAAEIPRSTAPRGALWPGSVRGASQLGINEPRAQASGVRIVTVLAACSTRIDTL